MSFVYFIAASSVPLVKIGHSQTPKKRFAELNTSSPIPLTLLLTVPGKWWDERALHRIFLASHERGEWFRITPELLALIDEIKQLGHLPERLATNALEPTWIKTDHSYRKTPEWSARASAAQKKAWADKAARGVT